MDWAFFHTSTTTPDSSDIAPPGRLDGALVDVTIGDGTDSTAFQLPNVDARHTVYQVTFNGTVDTMVYMEFTGDSDVGDIVDIFILPCPVQPSLAVVAFAHGGQTGHGYGGPGSILSFQKVIGSNDGSDIWIGRNLPAPV